jgi:hypothetical protein
MKAKYAILLIAFGFCLDFLGSLMKITHSREANTVLIVSTLIKIAGVLLLSFKVVQYEGFRKFMNK